MDWRGRRWSTLLLLWLASGGQPTAGGLPHVRAHDALLKRAINRGLAQSATFRTLFARLSRSDVIVHVEHSSAVPPGRAMTQFIADVGSFRYVRITMGVADDDGETVALLGHELRHAVELAESDDVRDERTYQLLYERIGFRSCRAHPPCYDTTNAVHTGWRVWHELREARGSHPHPDRVMTEAGE